MNGNEDLSIVKANHLCSSEFIHCYEHAIKMKSAFQLKTNYHDITLTTEPHYVPNCCCCCCCCSAKFMVAVFRWLILIRASVLRTFNTPLCPYPPQVSSVVTSFSLFSIVKFTCWQPILASSVVNIIIVVPQTTRLNY